MTDFLNAGATPKPFKYAIGNSLYKNLKDVPCGIVLDVKDSGDGQIILVDGFDSDMPNDPVPFVVWRTDEKGNRFSGCFFETLAKAEATFNERH
jgi:hypothetical protein